MLNTKLKWAGQVKVEISLVILRSCIKLAKSHHTGKTDLKLNSLSFLTVISKLHSHLAFGTQQTKNYPSACQHCITIQQFWNVKQDIKGHFILTWAKKAKKLVQVNFSPQG